jgi:hypothetical protein
MSTKRFGIESQLSPLYGDDGEGFEDEMVDNPLTRAAKQQIATEEGGGKLDIDDKFDVEDEEPDEDEDEALEDETEDEESDDEEEVEETAEDEEEDDDTDSYSDRVKKRIRREKKRSDRLQNQLSETEARLARLESRWEAEADEKKLSETREKIEQSLTDLRAQKREALEEGDTDKLLEIDEKIFDLRADLRNAETKATEARQRLEENRRSGEVIDGIDLGKLPKQARDWINEHPQFRTDEKFRRAVLAADNYLTAKGLNHQSKDYWQKLEREVAEDFPRYFKKKATVRRKPASVTAGSKGTSMSEKASKARGKVRITAEDKRNMERFGLDPNNRDHLREFAAAKLTS